jgi:hypothetical protein
MLFAVVAMNSSRLCRLMCGKAPPYRQPFIYSLREATPRVGGIASAGLIESYGRAESSTPAGLPRRGPRPFRTSGGKAASQEAL